MITKYESGSQITVQKAEKIYDLFGHSVFDKVDMFSHSYLPLGDTGTSITRKYTELGFDAAEARKVPFNVIATKDNEIILTEVGDRPNPNTVSLSRLLDADNLLIFNKRQPREKEIPTIARKEFMEFDESEELIKFLREF
ncbi:hypothetical protein ACFL96_19315 [Thermoproteota archaeon]